MKNISHTQSKALAHLSSAMKHLGVNRLNTSTQMFGFGGLDDPIESDSRYEQLSSYQKRQLCELRGAVLGSEQAVRQCEIQIEESVEKTRTGRLKKELRNLKRKAIEIEQEYEIQKANILKDKKYNK